MTIARNWDRNLRQRSGGIDCQSWGKLSKINIVFLRRYSSICIQIFKKICKEHGIETPPEYFCEALYHDPITSGEATNILLSLENPPTCIFYPDDYSALGGIRELNSHNLKPGKDISIVGYDGIMLTSMMLPPLTTYEQNGVEIGRKMAEALIQNIEESDYKSKRLMITGRLLKGGTVSNI